jgi:hypothetical protein
MTREEAVKQWHEKVVDRPDAVDPDGERDWWDLAYGFFLALGFDVETAQDMAGEVHYGR